MPTDWSDNIVICDLADEPEMSEELNNLFNRLNETPAARTPNAIVNLADVTYVNSSNIAQLLRIRRLLVERERSMRVCSVADAVWSIMLLTGLDKVFQFTPDKATAIASFQLESE